MSTITVWLLISLNTVGYSARPVTLVERFASVEECQRVAAVIRDTSGVAITKCIQATIVKP